MEPFELVAAPHTAMNADGSVNLPMIDKQVESLAASGVDGAFICGTTGEGQALTREERMSVALRWRQAAGASLRIYVHVGHVCLADARALAGHAASIGADAIAALGPYFTKPATVHDLAGFCAKIASAAPGVPFYYYHIPSLTGLNVAVYDFLSAAGGDIPTLRGAKFTHEDLMDYHRCLRMESGRYRMLFGRDEILLAALALGAPGAVGTTYGYAAPLYRRLLAAFDAGNLPAARDDQASAIEMIALMRKFGGLPASKAMMTMTGLDMGPCRPPLTDLTADRRSQLRAELEAVGFFQWCNKVR